MGAMMKEKRRGLYPGIPINEYHKADGANQSRLMILRDKSPAHLRYAIDTPPDSTPAMRLGAAIHDAVLCPDLFKTSWKRAPEGDRRKKEIREAWDRLANDHPDAEILKPEEYDTALAVRDAISSHRYARQLMIGDAEQSAWWEDEDTGVLCKGRFDLIGHKTKTLVDLKTTRDASPGAFTRAIYSYGYYIQAAHYMAGATAVGLDIDHYAIVAVEKEPPYGVAIYRIRDDAIIAGQDELRPLLERYAECEQSGEWPGYPIEVQDITLPYWAWRQVDERTIHV